ncbi:MAG: hypothetical protein CL940_07890 [Deltaproteobacteria bacterium]|nr:hypothetical protein [Deltaproteobacteria bacterium]
MRTYLLIALLLFAACGDDTSSTPASDVTDAQVSDTLAVDTSVDESDTAPQGEDDVLYDDEGPLCEWSIPPARSGPDPSISQFAMSLFHYNIEYVIGGLETVDESGETVVLGGFEDAAGWDNDRVEDWIVTETLLPILEMYKKHPGWGVTIELQAYMVEIMAERHPEGLALMRELAQSGQVELVSFHYAAQLFLAFPKEDMERSIARTKAIFEDHCLPLSGVVFNQEGQAGEGRQRMLVEEGYEIGVYPKNLWGYVRDGETPWPYYSSEGGTLIVGPGEVDPESGVTVAWDFFDDGELRAIEGGMNPYFAYTFEASEARVAEFEAELQAREDSGFSLVTIKDYVDHLEAKGVEKKPAPPLLDGTWQPPSTDSIHRWLGGRSQAFHDDEEDNRVRAGNARARARVAATQRILDKAVADGADLGDAPDRVHALWKALFHAQVSDASGVNPWLGELLYCVRLNDWITDESASIAASLRQALGLGEGLVRVDLETGEVDTFSPVPEGGLVEAETPPVQVSLRADKRAASGVWYELSPTHWQYVMSFEGALTADGCDPCDGRRIEVGFARTADEIAYSPGLIEDEVRTYGFDEFSFQNGEVYLPLPNGLIGLGDDLWVIKHVRTQHIAARVAPADEVIAFIDATPQVLTEGTWVFDVVKASADEALALANRINTTPVVVFN